MYWIFQQFHQNFPNFLWWKLTKIRLFWYPVQLTEACKITLGGAEDEHFPLFQSLCQIGLKNNPKFIQTNPGDISNIIKSKHLKSILILFWEKTAPYVAFSFLPSASQRAKFAEKVHKPPLWVNVINFELNGLDASIWVPWSPSDPKKSWCTDRSIQIHKKQAAFLHLYRVRDA